MFKELLSKCQQKFGPFVKHSLLVSNFNQNSYVSKKARVKLNNIKYYFTRKPDRQADKAVLIGTPQGC